MRTTTYDVDDDFKFPNQDNPSTLTPARFHEGYELRGITGPRPLYQDIDGTNGQASWLSRGYSLRSAMPSDDVAQSLPARL